MVWEHFEQAAISLPPCANSAMEEGHRPLWRHFITISPEADLSTRCVLNFGCNRGGFMRLLYALKPYRQGFGVDLAEDSIAAARSLVGTAPIKFEIASDLSAIKAISVVHGWRNYDCEP